MKILFSLKNSCLDFLHARHDTLYEAQLIKIIAYSNMQLLTYDKVADFVVWPVKPTLGVDVILLSSSAAQFVFICLIFQFVKLSSSIFTIITSIF